MGGAFGIDESRIWSDLMGLAEITDPARPWTRRSFTPLFDAGRHWLSRRFSEAGLAVRLDPAANLFGRLEGSEPGLPAILLGSHSDSVPSGGRFDGPAGVIAALEVVRALQDDGRRLRHPVEVVDCLAEEPSDFGLSCIGSRAMAGRLEPAMLDYRGPGGERLGDAIDRVGGDVARLAEARRADVAAFLELHIEQGVVLERSEIPIGIVTGIVGIVRLEIVFKGEAAHAGTMPMAMRRDAGVAAARFVGFVSERAAALAQAGRGYVVATTGVIEVSPNAVNVVPERARVVVDARAEDGDLLEAFVAEIEAEAARIAAATATTRERCAVLSRATPAACDPALRALLAEGAEALGLASVPLPSGAGHDAAFLSRIAPAAMVFIPCRAGRSHCPEEWAEPAAVAAGAAVMLEAVLRFDARAAKD
ncbi:Zn-dependent hydrolase [Rhodoplanes sp. TEM]|uniref:Zn-dependent hydrolase n=1 Tax=Rhodoplanes tepidamans TaxID=200616 RepID=A0ABT5JH96_RHOTP|nr:MULTISPECIES: Zn-dependent hydrolase [Rhodoplanes]MDC7789090.1 Zn-dependent hydrolase [Rhodoplanes tepidamans]MDC7986677.1 Zn-dependent hydrolase [Rhodoplanes sp. TEM]MDQ0354424.1 N-carbamoyl-L-amino-acid hydrolase [Rhodoplanes tepidamans]